MHSLSLLITCEHGGNSVPADFRHLFVGHKALLRSHRGWDPGTLILGEELALRCTAPLIAATHTRLLVDLNRSPHHRHVFSEITKPLEKSTRGHLLGEYHSPHRHQIQQHVAQSIQAGGWVVHIGVHSFTPQLGSQVRNADVGLLYDPRRGPEAQFAHAWRQCWQTNSSLKVRMNYPYRGIADGLTTYLRTQFPQRYVGIELEINQRFPLGSSHSWEMIRASCRDSLSESLAGWTPVENLG
ncbi:MAG: N-formylglutamate amidohydrolase [Planctomycetales bacterium]|nr:N-formylglutamate amidohydrolase [Planctomycetales bacterium]